MSLFWFYRCPKCQIIVPQSPQDQDELDGIGGPAVHSKCGNEMQNLCNECKGLLRGYYQLIDDRRLCVNCIGKTSAERRKLTHEYKVLDQNTAVDRHVDTDKINQFIQGAKIVAASHPGTDIEQEQLQLAEWLEELKFQRSNVERLTTALTYKNPKNVRVFVEGIDYSWKDSPKEVVDDERMLRAERLLLCTARLVSAMNHGTANMKDILEQDELAEEFGRQTEGE